MDNNLVSVVKGNDFILDLYVSKYDKDQGKQVPYDVSDATDVVLRLIGNNGFIKVIRDAQPNGFKITANVDGRLRDGKYGVELLFKINNMDKRIYQANKIEILNCNCCVDAGAQTTHVIPTYDLSMYMGVDVEKINFGAVTYGNIDSVLSETSPNPVMNKTVTAALKEAGKISDVLVNGESVVKDKVAEIIMPTKVSELDNDAGYLTEHQSLTDYAKISDVDASLDLKADKTSIPTVPTKVSAFTNDAGYLTEHQSLTTYAKKTDIPDTTNFATKDEIPTVPTKVSAFTNDAGYLTEHQSLTTYAKISDVDASLDLKANKAYVEELETELEDKAGKTFVASNYQPIGNYITTIPAEYVTETELEGKGYLTEHQSLSDYAKISDVDASLALKAEKSHKHKMSDITDYTAPDLSPYALKETVEDNYQYAEDTYTKKEDSDVTDVSVRLLKSSVDLLHTELSEVSTTANRADTNAKNIEDILLPKKIDKGGIKTINGQSLEGNGNIDIMPGGDPVDLSDYAKISDVDASLNLKADKTSIPTIPSFKTINGEEITGTGNIEIKSGSDPVDLSDYAKITDVDASLDLKADKTSIPTIPTKVSAFTNDAGYLTEHQSLTDYAKKTDIPVIPTKLSAFNNDEGFIKNTVTDLVNYYKKSETYTQAEVNELISKIPKFAIDVVDELPTSEISLTTVYLVKTSETGDNMYTEYIYVNNVWEKLGEQKVDLTDYYTKNQIDNFLNEKADKTEIPDMKPYAKISDVDASLAKYTSTDSFNALNTEVLKKANKSYVDETFQVKGDYITEIPAEYVTETELEGKGYLTEHQSLTDYAKISDVDSSLDKKADKTSIPTKVSELDNDAGYLTEHQSLTDYAKKTDIVTYKSGNGITINADNKINALIGKGEGEGSLLGPNATSANGRYAVSLGYQTQASRNASYAEGSGTRAFEYGSHAEGGSTKTSGYYSHAEGYQTTASGYSSHAEGYHTTTSGDNSHAEGYYTTASNNAEHASGHYNISNKASNNFGDAGNTLFSVGNGTSDQNKHNAFEIRQNGDIYITDSFEGEPYKLQDKLNNFATKSEINSKQDTLVSGTSIKTVNGESILGEGNITIESDPVDLSDYAKISDVDASLDLKADKTSIPTVPTKVSAFTNDALYVKEFRLLNYYTKSEIDSMVGDINNILETI